MRLCQIDDLNADTFRFLRDYFYNLDPVITISNAVGIVYAATKYILPALQHPIHQYIHSLYHISSDSKKESKKESNTGDIYTCLPLMIQLYDTGFHDLSLSLLHKSMSLYRNAYSAMEQQGFLELPLHILKGLIHSDAFGADEYDIYRKVIQWVEHRVPTEEAIKALMQPFRYSIRWPLIPLSCYQETQCGQYCLSEEQREWIMELLSNPTDSLMSCPPETMREIKCFYRDHNKHLDDAECLSFPYYSSLNDKKEKEIDTETAGTETQCSLQFVFVDLDFDRPERERLLKTPTFYGCSISTNAKINDFRRYCCQRFDIGDFDNIFVCLVLEGKIFHVFHGDDSISDLNTDQYLICVYHVPLRDIRGIKVEIVDSDEDGPEEQKEKGDVYPYTTNIEGYSYRWNYVDDIERQRKLSVKPKKKRQHLLSIVHVDCDHHENLKPLCGVPLLLNLYCESKVNLFTLQKHFLCDIAKLMIDDDLYESVMLSERHSIQFEDECIKKYCNLMVRRQFIYYSAMDKESMIKMNKADAQNVVCLRFESDQIHNFKRAFTSTIEHCRKHISAPPSSMEWKATAEYTEKKMIRKFRNRKTVQLKAKPSVQNVSGGGNEDDNKEPEL